MSNVSHGVNANKTDSGVITPAKVDTGLHFVVGTAPVHMVDGKVNEVIMASSYKEAVTALGYSDNWKQYSLCEEIYTAFTLFNVSPVFFVNVLDPKKHKKAVANEKHTVVDNQIILPLEAIASSVKIEGKEAGTDFEAFYSDTNCVVEFLTEASGEMQVNYDAVDPTQVTKDEIIGGYSISTHKTTGLELIDTVFPRFTKVPDLILCPNWSHDPAVAAVMSAKAENINGLFEAMAILDVDCTEETGATYYTEVPEWKKKKNFTKKTEIVCFPKVALGERKFNLSTQLASNISTVDNTESYGGGTPCESASNKPIQADRTIIADGSEIIMDIQQANYLNENGVVTALNFISGFTSWGNYTACYPANNDVTDYFYCINRMFKWVGKTLILTYWNYIDRGIKRRLIDAIVQSINDWLSSLSTDEKIIGGRVEFNESENSATALAAGIVRFHIYMTPPSPMQKMDFVLEYDLSYLTALVA